MKKILIILFSFSLGFTSCHKEEDTYSPLLGSHTSIGVSLFIKDKSGKNLLSDENMVDRVSITDTRTGKTMKTSLKARKNDNKYMLCIDFIAPPPDMRDIKSRIIEKGTEVFFGETTIILKVGEKTKKLRCFFRYSKKILPEENSEKIEDIFVGGTSLVLYKVDNEGETIGKDTDGHYSINIIVDDNSIHVF